MSAEECSYSLSSDGSLRRDGDWGPDLGCDISEDWDLYLAAATDGEFVPPETRDELLPDLKHFNSNLLISEIDGNIDHWHNCNSPQESAYGMM